MLSTPPKTREVEFFFLFLFFSDRQKCWLLVQMKRSVSFSHDMVKTKMGSDGPAEHLNVNW